MRPGVHTEAGASQVGDQDGGEAQRRVSEQLKSMSERDEEVG
eukprot:CAMPEP_0175810332 /NCGR_PEP_ID=MMETSP0107_2-20121207/3267_1 /TAXON_ID=195067 ORGANISM="Goniomonas pacifica, Strain CCMP1869" /NCGR_SAMPLE_ID=MMETSP0107_2 /ASSEMBLY_ACC=CAM_ASM_000203 /LENGTH=41 /DNA_ID= /DNA_START= /DNA_END= /DNA_ORIENTATION=